MTWIRIDAGIAGDPKLQQLAEALAVAKAFAIGLTVSVFCQLPTHARTGDLAGISDATLEDWAGWRGKRGRFATAFRLIFCTGTVVSAWDKHNGAPVREAIRNLKNVHAYRDRQRSVSGDVSGDDSGDVIVNDTIRYETERTAVAFPRDSEKPLHQLPPAQNQRTRGSTQPVGVVALGIMARLQREAR